MSISDPIADALTRIRNANTRGFAHLEFPASKLVIEVLKVLKDEGFIRNLQVRKKKNYQAVKVFLSYPEGKKVLQDLQRVSKPGRRVYVGYDGIPKIKGGLGIAIVSTSQGVMPGYKARRKKIGGEVLAAVW